MKKINKRLTIITNAILSILLVVVVSVAFIPTAIAPSYGGIDIEPKYNGNTQKKRVSIMVNVYENSKIVKEMVNVFNNYNATATFFVGGCWADDNGKTLEYINSNGHEIGNHGYFHKDHKRLNYDQNEQEIRLTEVMVKALVGIKPNLFAPPSGSFSNTTLQVAEQLGYTVIMWSKDTIDWRDNDKDLIYKRATKNASNGDLILMHPKEHSLAVLPKIIEFYQQNGFEVVSVSENLS